MLHVTAILVGASGILYGVMKYFLRPLDPDSPVNHPWQPWVLDAHVLAAPLFVFALGLIFRRHAMARIRNGEQVGRRTGIGLVAIVAPVILSGYVLQALTGDSARRWTGWSHTALGLLFALAYALHPRRKGEVPTAGDEVDVMNGARSHG